MIQDVLIAPLKKIPNEKGDILHVLRNDAEYFQKFGEVYCSYVNAGAIKGWKKHLKQTQLFSVPLGNITVVLYDERTDSPTQGEIQEVSIGIENYQMLRIPPKVWYGFKACGSSCAMIVNCVDIAHDPNESVTCDLIDNNIPYCWNKNEKIAK